MREYTGIVSYVVFYRPKKLSNVRRCKHFNSIDDAKMFKDEIMEHGWYFSSCYNYIGKKVEL